MVIVHEEFAIMMMIHVDFGLDEWMRCSYFQFGKFHGIEFKSRYSLGLLSQADAS